MKHRSMSRAGVKQTSTPLNNNKGVVFFKNLSNVSSIRNKCTKIRHSIIESPSIFDWKNAPESPTVTDSYNNYSKSSEEEIQRRPDTPLKSQRKSRFSDVSLLCPVKLRFSKISSSSDINSKLSDIKRRSSSTVNKYLYANYKPGSDDAEKGYLKIIKTHELLNTPVEQQTKQLCNVSLGQRECVKFDEKTCRKSIKTRIRCERNQVTTELDAEKEVGIHSGLLTSLSTTLTENAYIESVDSSKAKSTRNSDEKKRKTFKNHTKRQRKDVNISNNFINETDSLDEKPFNKSKCSSTHITGTTHGSLRAVSKKRNVERGKELCTKAERKRGKRQEREKKVHNAESKHDVEGLVLDSTNIQSNSDKEVVDKVNIFKKLFTVKKKIISKQTMMGKGRKVKNVSQFPPTSTPFDSPVTTNQKLLFESLSPVRSSEKQNKSCSSGERPFSRSQCSSIHIAGTTHDSLRVGSKKRNVEGGKNLRTKSKRKRGERQEQEKEVDNAESKGDVEGLVLYSTNIQSNSDKEVVENIFKKPFTVKKKIISKQTMMRKGRKVKNVSLFPPTSTPFDSPGTANQKLPLLFESLSPVRSSEKNNKSCSSGDFRITKIKAKRTYSKTKKINSKLDKEISKWESFLKKSSYREKNNNYVNETSILRNSGSIHLFETPPIGVNEGAAVDTLFPKSRSKRRKASEIRCRQTEKRNSVTTKKVKAKKWFETTNMQKMADHFNEISQVSLVIEKKRKMKRIRKI